MVSYDPGLRPFDPELAKVWDEARARRWKLVSVDQRHVSYYKDGRWHPKSAFMRGVRMFGIGISAIFDILTLGSDDSRLDSHRVTSVVTVWRGDDGRIHRSEL